MAGWSSVEYLGVVLSGVAAFAVGAAWYMTLAERWMKAVGRTKADIEADKSPLPFVIAFASGVLAAAVIGALMRLSGLSGPIDGLLLGLAIGGLIVAPWIVLHYAFAGRPRELWWIDGGHTALSFAAAGLVLGFFF